MAQLDGFYHILAVGGVTADDNGQQIPATQENVQDYFPEPLPMIEDDNGYSAVPMPTYDVDTNMPELRDDGFIMKGPDPADNPAFREAVEFAKENGLTAVLVEERQDVDADGRERPMQTLRQNFPKTIYLDQEGNQVEPEGAPSSNPFGAFFKDLSSLEGELTDDWGATAHEFSTGNGFTIENMFSTMETRLADTMALETKLNMDFA